MSTIYKELPFPRGQTYGDGGTGVLTASTDDHTTHYPGEHLLGRVYEAEDTEHSTGTTVKLRIVRLENAVTIPGTAAAPLHKLYAFGTTAKDFGRTLTGTLAGAGVACKPLDDAYAGAKVLAQYDLAYVVEAGPCKVTTGASGVSLAQHAAVASDTVGCVAAAAATAGQFVVGTIDEASTAEDTEVIVWIKEGLSPSDAAG